MSKSSSPPGDHPADLERWRLRLREGALIGFAAIFLYTLVALLTYSGADPGWSRTGSGSAVRNAGGPAGAWLADVFFALFGYMAYLFPLMLGYRAWVVFRDRYITAEFDWAARWTWWQGWTA